MANRLGIDHGTTNTVASIAADDAPVQPGSFASTNSDADETIPGQVMPRRLGRSGRSGRRRP